MKNTKTTVILVLVAVALIAFLGGFALKNVISPPKEKECPKQVVDNCIEKEPEIEKGACPLTKFDQNYTLTDEDKEEIAEAIVSETAFANLQKESIIKVVRLRSVRENGYAITVGWDEEEMEPHTGGNLYFIMTKVNGKFKYISGCSGGSVDYFQVIDSTIEKICK